MKVCFVMPAVAKGSCEYAHTCKALPPLEPRNKGRICVSFKKKGRFLSLVDV